MGIDAEDYDIKNEYGETDHQIDLFEEIERGAVKPISINGKTTHDATIFDSITSEDLIMAFFPCIYFAENNQMQFCGVGFNQKNLNQLEKLALIIQRNGERARFYEKLLQLFYIAEERLDYNAVREIFTQDPRINPSHTFVYPDTPYWDSHCLNKDVATIADNPKAYLLRQIINFNNQCKKSSQS